MNTLARELALLRAELWMVVGDVAFAVHWWWFAHGAYQRAVDAAREAQRKAEVSSWLNPDTWVEDCDLCGGDHPEGPCQ